MMQKRKFYSNSGKIKCSGCGNYHWQWWMISHQTKTAKKIGCASYMEHDQANNRYQIHCCYGSGYDMMIFNVMAIPKVSGRHLSMIERLIRLPQAQANHVICDKCIERLIRKKNLRQIDSF